MRKFVYIMVLSIAIGFTSNGQEWQHIDASDYSISHSFFAGSNLNRNFKINPYDNSIWMTRKWGPNFSINTFDAQGVYHEYDYATVPLFNNLTTFEQIGFTSTNTFVVSPNHGLFSFDGSNWQLESGVQDGCSISSDGDTIWMARTNENYIKWFDGSNAMGVNSFRRIETKNGISWVRTSSWQIIGTLINDVYTTYSPDTSMWLSWNNYDFKFPHHTDTMYTSSELGISLAHNGGFIDTITPNNTTNMPGPSIIEFEFDQNDNIWALFAPDFQLSTDPTHLAYYDQPTKTWSQIYTGLNSPLNFSAYMTIELDTAGNLWVINQGDLFVLKINNWPTWLDDLAVSENSVKPFLVYPNPTKESLSFQLDPTIAVSTIEITDLQGRVIQQEIYAPTIQLKGASAGTYFVRLLNNGVVLGVEKFIVE